MIYLLSIAVVGLAGLAFWEYTDSDPEDVQNAEDLSDGGDGFSAVLDDGVEDVVGEDDGENTETPDILFLEHGTATWSNENFVVNEGAEELEQQDPNTPLLVKDSSSDQILDLNDFDHVIVESGEGDTVFGSDNLGLDIDFVSLSTGGALVYGGESDGIFISSGSGDTIFADGGNDLVVGDDGMALFSGGEGNDTIFGSYETYFDPISGDPFDLYTDGSGDTLLGGAGDDFLVGATGDVLAGGSGSDTIHVFGKGSCIEGFNPDQDNLIINIEIGELNHIPEDYSEIVNNLVTVEMDGDTFVTFEGEIIASLSDVVDISVEHSFVSVDSFGSGDIHDTVDPTSGVMVRFFPQ